MSTVKRVRLATLLTVALVAGPAQAQSSQVSGNARLQPVPGSDETDVSGAAKFQGNVAVFPSWWGPNGAYNAWFDGTLTLSCRGLTPFATYLINESAYFTADSNGRATLTLSPFTAAGAGWGGYNGVSVGFQVTVARQVTGNGYAEVLQGGISVKVR